MLYVVATPIGNLEDVTLRSLRILKEVDLILCEDTRTTKKLLARYDISTPTLSYHQHSNPGKINYIIELLVQGKDLALVSDAGTPGISDPGGILIDAIIKNTRFNTSIKITVVPGPSALTAAASISGLAMEKFLFLGFPPHKKKRKKFFEEVVRSKHPVIFYESPHRIIKSLRDLRGTIAEHHPPSPKASEGHSAEQTPAPQQSRVRGTARKVVVCRELTKKFETVYRGNIGEVIQKLQRDKIKGEFVVVVGRQL